MIRVENVSKSFSGKLALTRVSVEFEQGRTAVVIGPSGCGKSTLLRLLIGLVLPDAGRVLVDGEVLRPDALNALRHKTGYVIQEGGLFPHLTAYDNVALLGRHLGQGQAQLESRIIELARLARLDKPLLDKHPQALSGGERQRVALMRALLLDPPILLLDEPLGALDPITRFDLQGELKEIFDRLKKTVVLVTHDMNEAAYFGDEIVLMRDGRIVQRGTSGDLLERPAEPFVSEFIRAQRSRLAQSGEGKP